jgi:hypothetical protein
LANYYTIIRDASGAQFIGYVEVADAGQEIAVPDGAYRYQQDRLFQPGPLSAVTGAHKEDRSPTRDYVGLGWMWDQQGTDWVDAADVRHGTTAFATQTLNAVSGSTATADYEVDILSAMDAVADRWCAFIFKKTGSAFRTIATTHQTTHPKPRIDVTYSDATTDTLECYVIATITASAVPSTQAVKMSLPVIAEFRRPDPEKTLVSATLKFRIIEHWSGSASMEIYVLDPPVNDQPVTTGIANNYSALDSGIDADANIIGVHRYLDGTAIEDFVDINELGTAANNTGVEGSFDPFIWDEGVAHDFTKYPHRALGKFVGNESGRPDWSLVSSSYTDDGFEPLAAGLGAMRFKMPAGQLETDGTYTPVVSGGDYIRRGGLGSHHYIFLPEEDFGYLKKMFVRYYIRWSSYSLVGKYFTIVQDGQGHWIDHGGKTGICPTHDTTYGGVSGTSGGGYGWQMRLSWGDALVQGGGGPDEGGLAMGIHTFDFAAHQPFGHNYSGNDTNGLTNFGQIGGLGQILYFDRWYCFEMEMDCNTVMAESPGYVADGVIRTWIDGRLAFERTEFVCRTLPIYNPGFNASARRPCRELGHIGLWFNWFHGGLTPSNTDRVTFVTGLAYGRERIGPMKMS